jgi:hypothetical protein
MMYVAWENPSISFILDDWLPVAPALWLGELAGGPVTPENLTWARGLWWSVDDYHAAKARFALRSAMPLLGDAQRDWLRREEVRLGALARLDHLVPRLGGAASGLATAEDWGLSRWAPGSYPAVLPTGFRPPRPRKFSEVFAPVPCRVCGAGDGHTYGCQEAVSQAARHALCEDDPAGHCRLRVGSSRPDVAEFWARVLAVIHRDGDNR